MRSVALAVLLCALVLDASAQQRQCDLDRAAEESRNVIPLPFSLLIPEGIRLGYDMRAYVRSAEFGAFDSSVAPEIAFDEIYRQSLEYAHGDVGTAFMAAAFVSFEHDFIPLSVFGLHINVPLTSEDHANFERRWSHLPGFLYHTSELDRDKLQHFYASAWLKSSLGMNWLAELGGWMVEIGESVFVEGSEIDPRDLHANRDGITFAKKAEGDSRESPSKALTRNP